MSDQPLSETMMAVLVSKMDLALKWAGGQQQQIQTKEKTFPPLIQLGESASFVYSGAFRNLSGRFSLLLKPCWALLISGVRPFPSHSGARPVTGASGGGGEWGPRRSPHGYSRVLQWGPSPLRGVAEGRRGDLPDFFQRMRSSCAELGMIS